MENSPSRLSSSTSMVHMFCEETGDRRGESSAAPSACVLTDWTQDPRRHSPLKEFLAKRSA